MLSTLRREKGRLQRVLGNQVAIQKVGVFESVELSLCCSKLKQPGLSFVDERLYFDPSGQEESIPIHGCEVEALRVRAVRGRAELTGKRGYCALRSHGYPECLELNTLVWCQEGEILVPDIQLHFLLRTNGRIVTPVEIAAGKLENL